MSRLADALAARIDYARRCESPSARRLELAVCAGNVIHWVNRWGMTFDPREAAPIIPFDLFPRQIEFLHWLAEREAVQKNGLAEKSRDVGVTWLCCAYAVHGWLFRPGYSVGFGSLKREEVDELGNMDTILEKCRFLLRNLPAWMLPAGYQHKTHASFCRILNPASAASITGEGGEEMGRGGRKSIFFLDEAARVARPQLVDAALSQTTRVRIDVSTPQGPGNSFYRRRFSGTIPVFTFHWKSDPRKSQEWYEAQKKEIGDPVIIAQELDIDYSASIEGICIPAAWVRAAVELEFPGWAADGLPTDAGLDIAEEGPNECAFVSRRGPLVDRVWTWNGDTTQTAWLAAARAAEVGARVVCYDADGIGAGVRGVWKHSTRPLAFKVRPVHGGGRASDNEWPDRRRGHERFLNLRAELWWMVRCRFERAHAYVTRGERHAPEDMISIPNDPQLIAELSLPLRRFTDTGKVKIESKEDMRKRGVKSPDRADGLVYSFCPGKPDPGGYAAGGEAREYEPPMPRRRGQGNAAF